MPDSIARIVSRCVIRLRRQLVFRIPTVFNDRLVILLSMQLEKVLSEVRGPGVWPVYIIGDILWDLPLIKDAVLFAAGLLEGGVATRKAVLTCIYCRLYVFPWH